VPFSASGSLKFRVFSTDVVIVMVAASVSGSEAVFVNSGAVVVVGVGRAHEPGHRVSVARGLWNSVVGAG